jgi:hypothetical protein
MNRHAQVVSPGIAAGLGLLWMLALSFVFPALASPVALAIGASAGLVLAFRDRLPHESPAFRLGLAILAIASATFVWVSLQPGYIGI